MAICQVGGCHLLVPAKGGTGGLSNHLSIRHLKTPKVASVLSSFNTPKSNVGIPEAPDVFKQRSLGSVGLKVETDIPVSILFFFNFVHFD